MDTADLSPYAEYWDKGKYNVPDMTGARHVLDAGDLPGIMKGLGLTLPLHKVLDVGCGTGRAIQICDGWFGVDIAPSCVEFCEWHGRPASLITGPHDLPAASYGMVLCISVFTHIPREERQAYLVEFARRAPRVVVDILPGDGTGDVAIWTAVPEEFVEDLNAVGYAVQSTYAYDWYDRPEMPDIRHLFYYAVKA